MNTHDNFLKFNDKLILFTTVDSVTWIGLRSLCDALKIEYTRSFKNAKKDRIIGPALAIQPMQVPGNATIQVRNVTCIPEFLVYGWLFSIHSENEELWSYKATCYKLLFDHFHGTIGNRNTYYSRKQNLIQPSTRQRSE